MVENSQAGEPGVRSKREPILIQSGRMIEAWEDACVVALGLQWEEDLVTWLFGWSLRRNAVGPCRA
eukprot:11196438-Lingulodinium_polyedra.AAC.1